MQTCQSILSSPREIVVASGDTLRSGFVSVSNQGSGESGNYALNMLRVPRPFLGVSQQFVGPGDGTGCSCSTPSGTSQSFELGGYRLDFIPTNDDVSGYAVRRTAVANPEDFLVDGGTQVCR